MLRKSLFFICILFAVAAPARAQFGQGPGPQGGRGAPSGGGTMEIRGRVMADSAVNLDHPIAVRLEGAASEILDTAFTDGAGNFSFSVARGSNYYVAVTVEGFEPARERVQFVPIPNANVLTNIVLRRRAVERVEAPASTDGDNPNIVDLRQLEANIPEEAREEFDRAIEEVRKNNYERAADRLEKAVELAPEFYDAFNVLGTVYTRLGRYRDAETILARALELNPAGAQPRINLGSMHLQEGESLAAAGQNAQAWTAFEKAVEVLDEAVVANSLSAPAHYYLGAAQYKVAFYRRSETNLSRALELDPAFSEVRLMLSNLYAVQDRFEEALAQLDLYLEENPRSPQKDGVERMKRELERIVRESR